MNNFNQEHAREKAVIAHKITPYKRFSSPVRESQRYDCIIKRLNQIFLQDYMIFQHTPQWKKRLLIQRAVFRKLCKHCGIQIEDKEKLPEANLVLLKLKEMIPNDKVLADEITAITVGLLPENATADRMKETFTQKMHRIFDVNIEDADLSKIIPYLIPEIFILLKPSS